RYYSRLPLQLYRYRTERSRNGFQSAITRVYLCNGVVSSTCFPECYFNPLLLASTSATIYSQSSQARIAISIPYYSRLPLPREMDSHVGADGLISIRYYSRLPLQRFFWHDFIKQALFQSAITRVYLCNGYLSKSLFCIWLQSHFGRSQSKMAYEV